jgi:rhodanese-related sulfurtransferase
MSGLRTQIYASKLAAAASGESFVVEGGLEAWKKHGLPVTA